MSDKKIGYILPCQLTIEIFTVACMLTLGILSGVAFAQVQNAGAASASPTVWTVLVGGEAAISPQEYGPSGAWQFMRFYPENITINVGDKIVWKLKGSEPHTVTFLAPGEMIPNLIMPENNTSERLILNPLLVLPEGGSTYNGTALTGSGQLDIEPNFPREYNLTFTKPGTYEYICGFHSMMKGNVTVQPAGTPYPKTQDQIDSEAAKQLSADMEAALLAVPKAENVSIRPGPNATTIHDVNLGYGNGIISWMRFVPTNLTVFAGDTVEWNRNDAEMPHTVTFLSGGKEPDLFLVEPQQRGPPKFVLNPIVQMPAGGKVYSGKGYFNSGVLWGTTVPLPGPSSYALTFDTPGNYEYICVLHDYMGMKGQITVLPRNK
jgi:plastocyanin